MLNQMLMAKVKLKFNVNLSHPWGFNYEPYKWSLTHHTNFLFFSFLFLATKWVNINYWDKIYFTLALICIFVGIFNVVLYNFWGLHTFNKFFYNKILISIKTFALTKMSQLTNLININLVLIKIIKKIANNEVLQHGW